MELFLEFLIGYILYGFMINLFVSFFDYEGTRYYAKKSVEKINKELKIKYENNKIDKECYNFCYEEFTEGSVYKFIFFQMLRGPIEAPFYTLVIFTDCNCLIKPRD